MERWALPQGVPVPGGYVPWCGGKCEFSVAEFHFRNCGVGECFGMKWSGSRDALRLFFGARVYFMANKWRWNWSIVLMHTVLLSLGIILWSRNWWTSLRVVARYLLALAEDGWNVNKWLEKSEAAWGGCGLARELYMAARKSLSKGADGDMFPTVAYQMSEDKIFGVLERYL